VFRNVSSESTSQPAPPSENDEQEPMNITDPTVMRALAHPVRMALIELFGVHATLTATQASEALGESPANCAFHLRTLARYGFVEEAGGGRGRERPWRASRKSLRIRLRQSELGSEQAQVAAGALEQVWHDRLFARIREVFVNRRWSADWEQAAGSSLTLAFFTAEELRTVRNEIDAVIRRHLDERRVDPARRPAGAVPVELVYFAYPRQDLTAPLPFDHTDESDEIPGEPA
jgi:predicted transcriptional regulator